MGIRMGIRAGIRVSVGVGADHNTVFIYRVDQINCINNQYQVFLSVGSSLVG